LDVLVRVATFTGRRNWLEGSLSPELLQTLLTEERIRANRLHARSLDLLEENLRLREVIVALQARLEAAGVPCDLSQTQSDERQLMLHLEGKY
jgi:hypothetical protein